MLSNPIDNDAFLRQAHEAAWQRHCNASIYELLEADQAIILLYDLQGQVDNGGFYQFYFNTSGSYATETLQALLRIGALKIASILRETNNLFPTQPVLVDDEARRMELDAIEAKCPEIFTQFDEAFYQESSTIDEKLLLYLKEKIARAQFQM